MVENFQVGDSKIYIFFVLVFFFNWFHKTISKLFKKKNDNLIKSCFLTSGYI